MLHQTSHAGCFLFHEVRQLGAQVADRVINLIHTYADRASLADLPPITLEGPGWDQPWEGIRGLELCGDDSGPADAELAEGGGGDWYTCLVLTLPTEKRRRLFREEIPEHPQTVEEAIAHEITHLRWPHLRHGPEFSARILVLLRGGTFPARGGWSAETLSLMTEARRETREWVARLPGAIRETRAG